MRGMENAKPTKSPVCAQGVPAFYSGANYTKENSVGFLIKRALAVLVRNLEHRMQDLDLTGTQWNPLLHVANGCDTVAACARESQIDAGAMTRMLDRLESKVLIQRERSTEDRRVVQLNLTEQGAEVAADVAPCAGYQDITHGRRSASAPSCFATAADCSQSASTKRSLTFGGVRRISSRSTTTMRSSIA